MRGFLRFGWGLFQGHPVCSARHGRSMVLWEMSVALNVAALFNQELARLALQPGS
jgi:hypothetical protein